MCLPQNVVRPRRGCSRGALFETMVRDALCPPPRISEPGTCWVGVQAWVVVIETGCMKRLSAVYACTDCHIVYRTVLHTTPNPRLEVELKADLGNRAERGTRNRRAWSEWIQCSYTMVHMCGRAGRWREEGDALARNQMHHAVSRSSSAPAWLGPLARCLVQLDEPVKVNLAAARSWYAPANSIGSLCVTSLPP